MDAHKTAAKKQMYLYRIICLFGIGALAILNSGLTTTVWAADLKIGDTVTIVTPGTEARLCPQPGCGPDQHITRIPAGTVFTIQGTDIFAIGTFTVMWFEVIYENQRGWISIFDTDMARK